MRSGTADKVKKAGSLLLKWMLSILMFSAFCAVLILTTRNDVLEMVSPVVRNIHDYLHALGISLAVSVPLLLNFIA